MNLKPIRSTGMSEKYLQLEVSELGLLGLAHCCPYNEVREVRVCFFFLMNMYQEEMHVI